MGERCWVLTGSCDTDGAVWLLRREPASLTVGAPASVEANWSWALAREEECGDVAGFWHTHPPGGGTAPSGRDVQTMRAWRLAFGKPLLCVIADGWRRTAYLFDHDESQARRLGPLAWTGKDAVRARTRNSRPAREARDERRGEAGE